MLTQSIRAVGNLFLCQSCSLCDRATPQVLCPSCWQQLQQGTLEHPASPTRDALPVLAWGRYQGVLKQAITALKYHNHPQLAGPLGRALGQRWQQSPLPTRRSPSVMPIPMHAKKQKERGFNQAELLAQAFCQQTGLKLIKNGLIRTVPTVPQFGLDRQARQQNLAGAFTIGRGRPHCQCQPPVLLVDDIYTTGTTVAMAAKELRRHGISVCGVVVIAKATLEKGLTPTHSPRDQSEDRLSAVAQSTSTKSRYVQHG